MTIFVKEWLMPIWSPLFVLVIIIAWLICWRYGWASWIALWNTDDGADKFFAAFVAVMSTVVSVAIAAGAGGLGYCLASLIGDHCDQVWQQCWTANMVSMRNADGQTGRLLGGIFLIAGSMDQSSTYFYYIKTSDGGFRQKTWQPDNDTTVYEEDRIDGVVVQFDAAFRHPSLAWIAVTDESLADGFLRTDRKRAETIRT